MGAFLLLVIASPDPSVVLSDAYGFGVPDAGCAAACYRTSRANLSIPGSTDACWLRLTIALDESKPVAERLEALRSLRASLGDAAFFSGRIPPPCPPARYGD